MFSDAAIILNPVTANSLAIIMIIAQAGMIPLLVNNIKAEFVSILSAKGSANFPKLVTKLFFLAKYPSKKICKRCQTENCTRIYAKAIP